MRTISDERRKRIMAETVWTEARYETCPDHGDTLGYHEDQGDEWELVREHLRCTVPGCEYEVWA